MGKEKKGTKFSGEHLIFILITVTQYFRFIPTLKTLLSDLLRTPQQVSHRSKPQQVTHYRQTGMKNSRQTG